MTIKKPTKKEMIYIAVVALVIIIVLFLSRKKKSIITNGAGQPADTGYLTFNMPPNNGGFSIPGFGNNYFGGVNMGSGGCNGCDTGTRYYGSTQDLSNALASSPSATDYASAINQAFQNMPEYMTAKIMSDYSSGSIDSGNQTVLSTIPVLALGDGTTQTIIDQPASSTGPYAPYGIIGV